MTIQSGAGASIAISTTAYSGTATLVGLQAKTYTTIGEVTVIPAFGKTYNLITHEPLATRQVYKLRGNFNNGSVTLDYAYDASDAGQILLTTAVDSDSNYGYRVTLQDGTLFYFTALAMSNPVEVGTSGAVVKSTTMLELNSERFKA